MAEFNLIDEPWIPCVDSGGKRVEYGIRDTFLKAHELREICDDSPLVTVALHRLLLAILYRAYKGPSTMEEWQSLHQKGRFVSDSEIDNYLNEWRRRFYLFDAEYPFMQVAGLDLNDYREDGTLVKDNSDGLMRLAREAPDKSGRILFDHRIGGRERPEYEPKQIVRMLLSSQSYSGTGIARAGKIKGQPIKPSPCRFAPCVDGLVLWLQGENLFYSILLNLVPQRYVVDDKPAWEEDASIVNAAINSWRTTTTFVGPVQRFAPLSRFVCVIDRQSMFFTNGLKTGDDSEDPMKIYLRPDTKKNYEALKLRVEKAAWRDAHALFSLSSPARNKPPASINHMARLGVAGARANLVGLATDQGKALLWRHERMPVSPALFTDANLIERLGGLLEDAERAAGELSSRIRLIVRSYRVPAEREPCEKEWEDINALIQEIDPQPAYWARLEKHFFALLENLANDWDTARGQWKSSIDQMATNTWCKRLKDEAQYALEESIRSLGLTARAIQAVARVRMDFNDDDLKRLLLQVADKGKGK